MLRGRREIPAAKRTQRSGEPCLWSLEIDFIVEVDVLLLAEDYKEKPVEWSRILFSNGVEETGRVAKDSLGTWEVLLPQPTTDEGSGHPVSISPGASGKTSAYSEGRWEQDPTDRDTHV